LVIEEDGTVMTFEKVNGETDISVNSPVKTGAVIGDYIGEWSAVYIEVDGVLTKLADIGAEMTLTITENSIKSHERYGEVDAVNTTTYVMDGYQLKIVNDDGTTQLLTLHENGMISLPAYRNTIWLENDSGAITQIPDGQWSCVTCGHEGNTGKFCTECGSPKPDDTPIVSECVNCGWQPEDPANPPKFCPECGEAFSAKDQAR
jgi:hypothetical protein